MAYAIPAKATAIGWDKSMKVAWHILPGLTVQTTELSPTGAGLDNVEKVTYQIDSGPLKGTRRQITVPSDLYTPENVRAQIEQDASNASDVGGLTSTGA